MRRILGRVLLSCVLANSPLSVLAAFDEALAAIQSKDYAKALSEARAAAEARDPRAYLLLGMMYQGGMGLAADPAEAAGWYEKAAQGGVANAYAKLAQLNMRGEGVPRDTEKALAYARLAGRLGDAEGMFWLHTILRATALSYLDTHGKPDQAKYKQLSARPLAERTVDTEAMDAIYLAADKKLPIAVFSLAISFGGTLGENNRERMLALAGKLTGHGYKPLEQYEKIARYINSRGQSLVTPQLFSDAQAAMIFAALVKTCGVGRDKDAPRPAAPELVSLAIAKPLTGASYLPSKVPGYERAYLVAGEWEEDWTYKGCDRTGTVRVRFTADSMGGATILSVQQGQDIPRGNPP